MDFHPMRALISREDDGDKLHAVMHDAPAMIPAEPVIGASLQIFLDSGKTMRTSPVKQVTRRGSELVVDTLNSRYHLKLKEAA